MSHHSQAIAFLRRIGVGVVDLQIKHEQKLGRTSELGEDASKSVQEITHLLIDATVVREVVHSQPSDASVDQAAKMVHGLVVSDSSPFGYFDDAEFPAARSRQFLEIQIIVVVTDVKATIIII